MRLGLAGKTALVTGASRGLGRSIALALAAEGARVTVVARTAADLDSLVEEMGASGSGHRAVAGDLMTEDTPTQIVTEVLDREPLDIMVHNLGGTLGVRGPLCSVTEWRQVWRLNVEIALEINRIVVPNMQRRGCGRIVHISSIAATKGRSPIPYSATKAAVNAYVYSLGRELARDGIVVSAVMPAAVRTKRGHWDIVSAENPSYAEEYLRNVSTGRFATPEEVADLVMFLCSERASYFAGAVIPIDGGTW